MTRSMLFEVPGDPVPKGRPRFENGHARTPQKTRTYEGTVRAYALQARQNNALHMGPWPADMRYSLRITLYPATMRRVDVDNLVKSLLDGGNGVLWDDDSQIDHIDVRRIWGDPRPRAMVAVEVITEPRTRPPKAPRPSARAHPWRSRAVVPARPKGVE